MPPFIYKCDDGLKDKSTNYYNMKQYSPCNEYNVVQ